jgi:hypothetical protein
MQPQAHRANLISNLHDVYNPQIAQIFADWLSGKSLRLALSSSTFLSPSESNATHFKAPYLHWDCQSRYSECFGYSWFFQEITHIQQFYGIQGYGSLMPTEAISLIWKIRQSRTNNCHSPPKFRAKLRTSRLTCSSLF